MRIPIPRYAKAKARQALNFNKKNPKKAVGLTQKEAKLLGINSGIGRAKQLINNQTISIEDAKDILKFYNRFKGKKTKRVNMAINLWGGREFAKELSHIINSMS